MAFLYEFGLFLAKTLTIVAAIAVIIGLIAGLKEKNTGSSKGKIQIDDLSEEMLQWKDQLLNYVQSDDQEDEENDAAESKKWWQWWKKADKTTEEKQPIVYVLDFNGDVEAEEVASLRAEVTAILQTATTEDEVVLRLTSPGGVVHGYGLAAAQLTRIRDASIPLTVAVDEVAASGGYLMAAVANKIIASPFAIVGSIGVVAQLPNFHRLLEKYDIDYEQFTAGKYKRTVTMFGQNSDEAKAKFTEELEAVHHIFQTFVGQYRPQINLDEVATGEHWLAKQAIDLHLVDILMTSDAYLLERSENAKLLKITYQEKADIGKRLSQFLSRLQQRLLRY